MKKTIRTLFFAVTLTITALAQQAPQPQPLRYSRVVPVEKVVVPDAEVRDVVAAAISTWPIPGIAVPDQNRYSYAYIDPKKFTSYSTVDLVKFEFNTIKDFIEGNGIFSDFKDNSAKIVLANLYGFEHEHAIGIMAQAAQANLYASIIATDGPASSEKKRVTDASKYKEKEKYTNQMSADDLDNDNQGKEIRKLLEKNVGYEMRTPTNNSKQEGEELIKRGDRYITMSAFYRNITIGPIQHLKEKVMIVLKDPNKGLKFDQQGRVDSSNIKAIFVISGNGNATPRMHNNLSRFFSSQRNSASFELSKFTVEHTNAILKTFAVKDQSARISEIEFGRVLRIEGQSGDEIFERSYTDGDSEINDRLAILLSSGGKSYGERPATRSKMKYKDFAILNAAAEGILTEITLSHFVLTNRDFVNALYEAWLHAKKAGRPFKIRGVLDGKFVGMRSYGLAAALKGLVAENPFGKEMPALDAEFAKYVEIAVNIERIPGATAILPDGPPTKNILQHGKMTLATMMVKMKSGEVREFAILSDGSMNMSGNEANLEVQDLMVISELSEYFKFAKKSNEALFDRTLGKTADGRPRGYMLEEYLSIQAIARLVGLDIEQMDPQLVKELASVFEKLPMKSENVRKQEMLKMKTKILTFHRKTKSELVASLQVSEEALSKSLDKLTDFVTIYSFLDKSEQGQIAAFSEQERLDVVVGLTEDPISAKRAISRVLKRNGLPFDILEQRAYQIYQQLDLETLFKAKGIEAPQFPIYKNRSLPILTKEDSKKVIEAVKAKNYPLAAEELVKIAEMEIKEQSFKVDITDVKGILHRLNVANSVLKKIFALPNKGRSTYKPTMEYLEEHLWSENYELLLLMRGYDRNAGQIVYYILVQKGYRGDELRLTANQLLSEFGVKPIVGPTVAVQPEPQPQAMAADNICRSLFQ